MVQELHIPGYSIVSKIAEGGMATVWKARQDKLDRVVAIKVLTRKPDGGEDEFQRFIYEARAAASLIHPNIVQVIDAGEQDGFMYYIMEFVPGPTAGELVEQGSVFDEPRMLQIAQDVAEALDYAWREHHVVHCDIKPDNLLLHRNGRTKVADLGLAQVTGVDSVAIEEGMTLGTPHYFPPEQALVEGQLDCRTDMYALGATLYHLGTGTLPFGDLEPEEVASEQVHGQLPNPKHVNPEMSYGMALLIERLMAKEREDRYSDWSEVMADLQAVKEGRLIANPLPAEVVSTVAHLEIPTAVVQENQARIRIAAGSTAPGARAMARRRRGGAPVQIRMQQPIRIAAGEARQLHAHRAKPAAGKSLWPVVTLLAILSLFLYAVTFLQLR